MPFSKDHLRKNGYLSSCSEGICAGKVVFGDVSAGENDFRVVIRTPTTCGSYSFEGLVACQTAERRAVEFSNMKSIFGFTIE